MQKEREQREKEGKESPCEVIVDDEERRDRTAETGGTARFQFVVADLEAAKHREKEEKENEEMAARASLLHEQQMREAEDTT